MTSSVPESWNRIEAWLVDHAPSTFAKLAPPAERAAIATVEEALGLTFPTALTESLLRHDGTAHGVLLPPFWAMLGTRAIVDAWRARTRIHGQEPSDAEGGDAEHEYGPWWHRQWIPFAADGASDYLVIDQRPSRRRSRIGDADHEDGCRFDPRTPNQHLAALAPAAHPATLESWNTSAGCPGRRWTGSSTTSTA